MLVRDQATGRVVQEPEWQRAARLGDAADALKDRRERAAIGDRVWAGIGASVTASAMQAAEVQQAPITIPEVIIPLPSSVVAPPVLDTAAVVSAAAAQ